MPEGHLECFRHLLDWFFEDPAADLGNAKTAMPTGRTHELISNCRVVVFTDGACSHNQDARFRRAGYGAYWADGHDLNEHAALQGWAQTNNRAELMAVIAVLQRDPRPVEIRTDSKYVINGFRSCLAPSSPGTHNADLWDLLSGELRKRPCGSVRLVKVKGHAKLFHEKQGLVTAEDRLGNDAADSLAVLGSRLHSVDDQAVRLAKAKRCVAYAVQEMMVHILTARAEFKEIETALVNSAVPKSLVCLDAGEAGSAGSDSTVGWRETISAASDPAEVPDSSSHELVPAPLLVEVASSTSDLSVEIISFRAPAGPSFSLPSASPTTEPYRHEGVDFRMFPAGRGSPYAPD